MKTPPLLMGAGLLFWGWQAGHLVEGALMAGLLEGAQSVKARWDFADEDFRRIWTFCALLLLGAALYAFTSTGGPGEFRGFFQNPNLNTERNAGNASARTVAALMRWLPMIFFLFMAAQAFSSREGVPAETISVILRLRWQRARRLGRALPAAQNVDISYPYFVLCLFAASFHPWEDQSFYWGLSALVIWALWPYRSRRFGLAVWAGALGAAILLGYEGQPRVWRMYRLLEVYNARWFVRRMGAGTDPRQSKTALGQIGRLKRSDKIVIRLEPNNGSRAPTLLREGSYRTWKGQVWYSELGSDNLENIFESPHTTWVLLPGKTNTAAAKIACYLPDQAGLLPLPTGTGRLENLSAWIVQKSGLGMVLVEGPGLVIFDALYEPGTTIDSPPGKLDTYVPPKEMPALDQVIEELQLREQSPQRAVQTVSDFFQDKGKFSYSSWQEGAGVRGTNATPLARFLLRTRRGHCEYFATATVLLLRQLGIPARYAVGYAVHEVSGQQYIVRQHDAHAWCLVWNPNARAWQDFDTTPASWAAIEARGVSPWQFLMDCWSRLVFEFAKLRWGQSHLRDYVLWGLGPVLVLLLYQIIVHSRRRRLPKPGETGGRTTWPGLDSEFYQVERKLAGRGVPRQGGEPLSAWLGRAVTDPAPGDVRKRLRRLLTLHYRYRFDPEGLSQADRENLRREATACLASMD